MSKIRVFSQEARPQTSDLEAAWVAKQDFSGEETSEDTGDEITIMDNSTGNMFTMFMKPDGTGMMIQQIVIKYERQPFITVPNLQTGEPNWQGVLDAAGIGSSGYTIQPYGPGANAPTTASSESIHQRAIRRLLAGYSARKEYERRCDE